MGAGDPEGRRDGAIGPVQAASRSAADPDAALFRPAAILAIGIAADGGRDPDPATLEAARRTLLDLGQHVSRIAAREAAFFGEPAARLRVVTRLADAGERALARAARSAGADILVVAADGEAPDPVPGEVGAATFSLPGAGAGAGSGARAADALLAQSDVILAAWSGRADALPGSTGALIQEAVERRIPVLLLPPPGTGPEDVQVIDDPDAHLLPARAAELPRVRLADNLDRVLARAFAPPAGREERQALRSFLAEPRAPRTRRPEYRALLLLARGGRAAPLAEREAEAPLNAHAEWERALAVARLVSPAAGEAVVRQALRGDRMEALAAFHSERVRSGVVLRYSGPAFGALMIALLAIAAPDWSLAWLGVQAVVMTLTIAEATFAARGRWDERWLDYRSLAERLRCDRFLSPLGIGLGRLEADTEVEDPAWTRWLHRRLRREHAPAGTVAEPVVEAAFRHLAGVEIAGQIRYHQGAARRYRSLARRLRLISSGSVTCIIAATACLFGLALIGSEPPAIRALLMVLLITLPSVFLAARGLRLEGAFELAAARSEQALASLRRLRERIPAVPHDYDRLVQASRAAAGAMILDNVDWRVGLQRSRTPYRAASE